MKREFINKVLNAIKTETGLNIKVKLSPEPLVEILNGNIIEAHLCVKHQLRPFNLPLILNECKGKTHAMVFSNFISRPVARTLMKNKIWFADVHGNIYINLPGRLFVYVIGKSARRGEGEQSTLITESGAKLILYLLSHGPEVRLPYRKIAEQTGLSLGRTSHIMKALIERKILKKEGKTYVVVNGKQLFEIWLQAYNEKLRPKRFIGLFISRFHSDLKKLYEHIKRFEFPVGIGDELAGEILTNYLKGAYASLWVRAEDLPVIRNEFSLLKTESGNIRVYEHFNPNVMWWSTERGIMPVPMVIGDLLQSDDVRNHETAFILQEKYLKWTM